jgi:hypothetical protein
MADRARRYEPVVVKVAAGTAAANAKGVGGGSPVGTVGVPAGASEIVTGDQTYALTVGSASGGALNTGPEFEDLGFRDVSGSGNALGAIHFRQTSHAFLRNVSFIDFANGSGAYFDSTSSSAPGGVSQYNFVANTTAINVMTPFLFQNGTYSSHWIIGGNLVSSQVGGGECIDFEQNVGASGPTTGGHNYLFYPQCNYFPTAIHSFNQNSDSIAFHAEQSATSVAQGGNSPPNVIGSPPSGTGVVIDGTAPTGTPPVIPCTSSQLAQSSLTSFVTGIWVTANCYQTAITSPTFSGISTPISDSGVSTQMVGAPPAVQSLTFSGSGNSMVQYFLAATGTNAPVATYVMCFSQALTVQNCLNTSPFNVVGIALAAVPSAVPGSAIPVQIAGLATVQLDGSYNVNTGDIICAPIASGSPGKATDVGANLCSQRGRQVGIAAEGNGTSATTAVVLLQRD